MSTHLPGHLTQYGAVAIVPAARLFAAHRSAVTAVAAIAAAVVLAGCGPGFGHHTAIPTTVASAPPTTAARATTTTAVRATTTTAVRATTTTTIPIPPHPQPTAEDAANLFMQSWVDGNRARSASVAVGSAVATLYATPYANQPLNDRGCTTAFPPLICTWGPYAGGSGTIYQVLVSPIGTRWYVSALTIES